MMMDTQVMGLHELLKIGYAICSKKGTQKQYRKPREQSTARSRYIRHILSS
jgi:hypothetical protein